MEKLDTITALKELKSLAYDAMVQIEMWQKKLAEINQQIAEAQAKESEKK